jgi:putative iron-regulated protein
VNAWKPESDYPKAFINEKPDEVLRRILTGMTSLSADEMAGERMTVALEKHDQENEQDCFSDFTLMDLAANQEGIIAVYQKTGLRELFAKTDKALESKISKQLETSLKMIHEIPAPFDKVVSEKKSTPAQKKVHKAIESLQKQAHLIAQMAKRFKVELNVQ